MHQWQSQEGELSSFSPRLVPCPEHPCFKLAISVVLILTSVWNFTTLSEKLGCSSTMGVGVLLFMNSKRKVLVFVIHHFISAEDLNVAPYPRAFMTLLLLLMSVGSTLPYVTLKVLRKGYCINQKFSSRQVNCRVAICFCPYPLKMNSTSST